MPPDKHTHGHHAKPLTPNLSSAFRQAKSPLTPKVFGSSNASPSLSAKRGAHPESTTASAKRTGEGQSTPTLSGNITPRSAARKSKYGTESPSTPDGATRSPRPKSMGERDRPPVVPGLGISSIESPHLASPLLNGVDGVTKGSLDTPERSGSVSRLAATTASSQFFHADEVKSTASSHSPEPPPQLAPKTATFYHATSISRSHSDTGALNSSSQAMLKQGEGDKFFYANEHPGGRQTAPKSKQIGRPLSPAGRLPRFQSPEVQKNMKSGQRPPSPLKESHYSSVSGTLDSARSRSVISPGNVLRHGSTAVPTASAQRGTTSRRTSLSSTTSALSKGGHRKSASTTSTYLGTSPVQMKTPELTPMKMPAELISPRVTSPHMLARTTTSPPRQKISDPRSPSLGSLNSVPSGLALDTDPALTCISPLQSPTKAEAPHQPLEKLQKMNELAANARRERKVLDLEISNSSLLAINKTLEREMRKQNAELRRFRRLSRSGRFSMAPGSHRSISGQSMLSTLTESASGEAGFSGFGESCSDEDEDDSEDLDSSFDDESSSLMSPTSQAKQRAKDEKRLMLDLSRHRQLLIDSEKMSQSIRRCLGWTEDLIKEGQKALNYQVKVSDVQLGGRVLTSEDVGEGEVEEVGRDTRKGLLSPIATMDTLEEMEMWASAMGQVNGVEEEEDEDGNAAQLEPD